MNEELKIVLTAVVNEAKQQVRAVTKELDFFRNKTTETALTQEQLTQKVKQQKQELAALQAHYNKIVATQGAESAAATRCAAMISTLSASYATNAAALQGATAASIGYQSAEGAVALAANKAGQAQKEMRAAMGETATEFDKVVMSTKEFEKALKSDTKALEKFYKEQMAACVKEIKSLIRQMRKFDDEDERLIEIANAVQTNIKEYKSWQGVLENLSTEEAQKELEELARKAVVVVDKLKDMDKAADAAGDTIEDEANKSGQSFSKMQKGAAAMARGVQAAFKAVGIAIAAVSAATIGLAEGTREYRTEQAKLITAFEAAGSTATQAKKTYNELYRVLGESDTAVEAANHLGQLTQDEKELAEWTKICQGAYATFGDSLPIESLTEAINETAKTGEITGALADAINWAGMSEDEFADALFWCNSEAEREQLIRDTLNGLYGEAAEGYEDTAASILAANEAQAALTESMAALGAAVEPVITLFKAELATTLQNLVPSFELVAQGITDMTQGVEGGAEKMTQGIKGMIDTILTTIVTLLPGLLNVGTQIIFAILDGLTAAFPDIINTLATLIPQVITTLGELIPKITGAILNALPLIILTILQAAAQILETLGEIIPEILDQIVEILPLVVDALVEGIPILLKAAATFFMAIVEALPEILPPLLEEIPRLIEAVLDMIIDNYPMLFAAGMQIFMALVDAIPVIIDALVEALPQIIVEIVAALVRAIPQLLMAGVHAFGAIVTALWKILPELLSVSREIMSNLGKELAKKVPELCKDLWNDMVNVFKNAPAWFKNTFTSVVTTIKNVITGLPTYFTTVKNKITDTFKNIGGVVGTALKSAVEKAVNGVLSVATNIINGFIKAINTAIDVINAIPGVDIKKLNTLNVPKLERGGVLKKGQVGLLEGNGAEAVVPLEKNTQWLDEIAKRLNGATGNNPRIVLKVDGKTLGEIAADAINDLGRQRGKTPLQVI